ncbi:hypothetical protein E3U23_11900 [Erythrobacter litoralis]|nr:hypothetical protein [Erythrobacter litoralis]
MDDSTHRSQSLERQVTHEGLAATALSPDPVCALLALAVRQSGRTRKEIGTRSAIHKDALRRILSGERSPTLREATAILDASGSATRTCLALCLVGEHERARQWLGEPVEEFIETFLAELPASLGDLLENQIQDIRPRWAKGAARRVARLLSDHIEDLDRRDEHVFT